MPMYETPVHVGAKALKAVKKSREYPIELGVATFTRSGKDGSEIILPLCGGDENVGEVLERQWVKGWDSDISVFRARICVGRLELGGVAAVAGTWGAGWIDGQHPILMLDETEVTVELEVPISDTGVTADRDILFMFFLIKSKITTQPFSDNNLIRVEVHVDESGLLMSVYKKVSGSWTTLFNGSTYDDASARDNEAYKYTIWRIVFHDAHAGTAYRHIHVYLKQGPSREDCEGATENELTTSPYDISDLLFNVAYPAYEIWTQNTTYFGSYIGSEAEALSTYLRVDYPDSFDLRHNPAVADLLKGDVIVWDTMGSAQETDWIEVRDRDHVFTGDCVIQNGLLRLIVDEGQQYGLELYYWTGSAWSQPLERLYMGIPATQVSYPFLKKIKTNSPEKTVIKVRLCEDGTEDEDYFLDLDVTLERGIRFIDMEITQVYPKNDVRVWFLSNAAPLRWGYAQDDKIGQDDLNLDGLNTTMTDNFLIGLDDVSPAILAFIATSQKPAGGNARFAAIDGGDLCLENIDHIDIDVTRIIVGLIPFSKNTQLFKEAESTTLDGGADIYDPNVGESGTVVRLDAQNEGLHWDRTAGTHLPEGRYRALIRSYGVGATQDFDIRVYNNSDSEHRNEENKYATVTAQNGVWTFHGIVFDVTAADVSGTDTIQIQVLQPNATPNTVYIDEILLVPIGNGCDWPQDQAHSAMRGKVQARRLYTR